MTGGGKGRILFAVTGWDPGNWLAEFAKAAPDREIALQPDGPRDPTIRYAVTWKHPPGSLAKLPNLNAIFSAGAGVDHIMADPELPDVPIVRVVANDLTTRMSEYVVWQALDHLRQGQRYRQQQGKKIWREAAQPAAGEITVGVMGLGELGGDAAQKLMAMGFNVAGWSRSLKRIEGVRCFAGEAGLGEFLAISDILVVLLPLTEGTRGIINRRTLSMTKRQTPLGGPVLINAGRGQLQVEADILQALDDGTLMAASLDVFESEPLAADSPLWGHPRVFVTPHVAASSEPRQLVPQMVRQMQDFERGLPLSNLVDRQSGY